MYFDETVDGTNILWPVSPLYGSAGVEFNRKALYGLISYYNPDIGEWFVGDSAIIFYSDLTTGLDPLYRIHHTLFPNPASDQIQIESTTPFPYATIEFFNEQGQVVKTSVLAGNHSIPVQSLVPGIYTYRIRNGHEWMTGKFVKQ